jgi:hypothetical protein
MSKISVASIRPHHRHNPLNLDSNVPVKTVTNIWFREVEEFTSRLTSLARKTLLLVVKYLATSCLGWLFGTAGASVLNG